MLLDRYLSAVGQGEDLSKAEASQAAHELAESNIDPELKAKFLAALATKGESPAEVAGFAEAFRELARDPGLRDWQADAIDVCGTGGDKQGTFNVSTTVTFVLAAAGVPVFKHGNRSITSQCGSSNLLEALGVDIMADDATLQRSLDELGFCFMFAPAFHPAFKEIMPVRQALAAKGQRTIFNILGPLINPARPSKQLLGVFSPSILETLASALQEMGLESGLVVSCDLGERGALDELSVAGVNHLRGVGRMADVAERSAAGDFGLSKGTLNDLAGGDVAANLLLLDELLAGEAPQALTDTVALNAGVALKIAGKAASDLEGIAAARDLLLGGATRRKIEETKAFFQQR